MVSFYINSSLYIQVLLATLMTWGITSLGSALVFFFKNVKKDILDGMLAASSGVMISASFFSLLIPAINTAETLKMNVWVHLALGFILGGIILIIGDILFAKYLKKKNIHNMHGLRRSLMLMFSITLHNIPEGLAIGVAFGSIAFNNGSTLASAFMLAVGVGIQNFPEGSSVSLPLRREGYSCLKAFIYGMLSGVVEVFAGLIGCMLVLYVQNILPLFLSFAAGAMIYVSISELIPESQKNPNQNLMSFFTILGFVLMMVLDIAFS